MDVARAAVAAARDEQALAVREDLAERAAGLRVGDDRAERDLDDHVRAVGAVAVAAHSGAAVGRA